MGINKIQFQKDCLWLDSWEITERKINATQHWLLHAGLPGLFVRSAAVRTLVPSSAKDCILAVFDVPRTDHC